MQAITKKDYKLVKYILANDFNITDLEDKMLDNKDVRFDLVGELSAKVASNITSELLDMYHDYTSVESGADDFACRFMLQKELASVIYKINDNVDRFLNPVGFKYSIVAQILGFISSLFLLGLVVVVEPIAGSIFAACMATISTLIALDESKYDTEYDRLTRMH